MKKLLSLSASLNTMKGFYLLPSAFPVKQTNTRTLSWPANLIGTSFDQIISTVVLQTMLFQTTVSSMTMMSESWKLNCFNARALHRKLFYWSFRIFMSFWAVAVFLLREIPCLCMSFHTSFDWQQTNFKWQDRRFFRQVCFWFPHNHFPTNAQHFISFLVDLMHQIIL